MTIIIVIIKHSASPFSISLHETAILKFLTIYTICTINHFHLNDCYIFSLIVKK